MLEMFVFTNRTALILIVFVIWFVFAMFLYSKRSIKSFNIALITSSVVFLMIVSFIATAMEPAYQREAVKEVIVEKVRSSLEQNKFDSIKDQIVKSGMLSPENYLGFTFCMPKINEIKCKMFVDGYIQMLKNKADKKVKESLLEYELQEKMKDILNNKKY